MQSGSLLALTNRRGLVQRGTLSESLAQTRFYCISALIALLILSVGQSLGQVTPLADSALAPVRFNPGGTFNSAALQWNNNALQSLSQGGGAVGDFSTDPSAYLPAGTVRQQDFIGTFAQPGATFPSWRGVADPPAPFDTVYGTALMFPLHLESTTTKFRLSNLDNVVASNDPNDALGVLSHGASGRNYSFNQIGIDYGPDGVPGTADDIFYNSGQSGDLPVNELYFTGIALLLQATDHGAGDQGNIDQSVAGFFSQAPLTRISNEYLLYDDSGNLLVDVTKSVDVVPEPTAACCMGVLTAGMLLRRRRD